MTGFDFGEVHDELTCGTTHEPVGRKGSGVLLALLALACGSCGEDGVTESQQQKRPAGSGGEKGASPAGGGLDAGESASDGTAGHSSVESTGGSPSSTSIETAAVAPLAGPLYAPAPGHEAIGFHGTDLGYTVPYEEELRILFGDTWADGNALPINPVNDDSQGVISLSDFPDGDAVDRFIAAQREASPEAPWSVLAAPPVRFELTVAGTVAPIEVLRDMVPLPMGVLKTPVAVFSSASDVFGVFFRGVSVPCFVEAGTSSCAQGYVCDEGLGTGPAGVADIVVPCVLGDDVTCVPTGGGGLCQDRTSSVYDDTDQGRISSVVVEQEIGVADPVFRTRYSTQAWATRKFLNPVARTVESFDPDTMEANDYSPPGGDSPSNDKIFVWGRPNFAGTLADGRDARLYFMYVDMPDGDVVSPPFAWTPRYFSGLDGDKPVFSENPAEAVALDLSSSEGDPATEIHDVVGQMTVAWLPSRRQWVMFYGGDLPEEVAEGILGPDSELSRDPSGALQVRFAEHPWGPWSVPRPLLAARSSPGDLPVAPAVHAPHGILHSPECEVAECAPSELAYVEDERGRLYAPNIIVPWTEVRNDGAVDIYWNVSTWAPYQVVLMRSRLPMP